MFEKLKSLEYNSTSKRDDRLDFIRGVVMFFLVVVHIDFFSYYNFIAWERIGVVTGAEGFVILSGIVLGMVNRTRIMEGNLRDGIDRVLERSIQLYRVSLFVVITIPILNLIPFIDASSVMTFTNRGSGEVYQLYPIYESDWKRIVADILLLKHGPHQFQVLGLYIILLALTPIAFFMFSVGRVKLFLAISWIIYFYNSAYITRPTGMQFEWAFPILTWQLIFFHGLAVGFYKDNVLEFFTTKLGKIVIYIVFILFFAFLFFTYNNPHKEFPEWMRFGIIPSSDFYRYYNLYFQKNTLGVGRLLNDVVVLIVSYIILTKFWRVINFIFGWLFVPVGRASLYVFIWHIYFCLLIFNIPIFKGGEDIFINTLGHTLAFLGLWVLVKREFLFRWVPR